LDGNIYKSICVCADHFERWLDVCYCFGLKVCISPKFMHENPTPLAISPVQNKFVF
jgi:hypothetical protein